MCYLFGIMAQALMTSHYHLDILSSRIPMGQSMSVKSGQVTPFSQTGSPITQISGGPRLSKIGPTLECSFLGYGWT